MGEAYLKWELNLIIGVIYPNAFLNVDFLYLISLMQL